MHELSICRSVADIVVRHAAGRPVTRVRLRVGQLRQIVPGTLVYCWDLVNAGPAGTGSRRPGAEVLAGSVLEVDSVAASVRCRPCGAHSELVDPVLRCGACGSADVAIVTGEEFLVTSFEVASDTAEV